MLSIFFGEDPEAMVSVDANFDFAYYDEWFEDDLVKQMVLDIDGSTVQSAYSIVSPVLGNISVESLSGGVKTLIQFLKDDEFYPDLIVIGANCETWLMRIAKMKDIRASLSGYDLRMRSVDEIYAKCVNDGDIIKTPFEWREKMLRYI